MPSYGNGNEKDIAKGFARAMAYKERMLDAEATAVIDYKGYCHDRK